MIGALTNHVWQSTVFALVVGALTVAFRHNRAQVRYWLWFSASFKFFIPFALLIGLGNRLAVTPAAQKMAASSVSSTITQFSQPFTEAPPVVQTFPTAHVRDWLGVAVFGLWLCGLITIAVLRWRGWQRIRAAVRASSALTIPSVEMPAGVRLRSTPGLVEPGVVGWRHPILLVPQGIADHLTPSQLEPVLAHELCHVRRRDNLTAGIHMVVEALFWFHPLVWWIGARLVDERERACDEDVLRIGGTPQAYAEGILRVCKRYVEMPLACVSGVGGSNLRKRIEAIMANRVGVRLNMPRRFILAGAALATVALPLAVGAMQLPQTSAQTVGRSASATPATPLAFEAASVKPNNSGNSINFARVQVGRFTATNMTLRELIAYAFGTPGQRLPDFQISDGPTWIHTERFDIVATASANPAPGVRGPASGAMLSMVRALLTERFQLAMHRTPRELPIYTLVMARSDRRIGPQLHAVHVDCAGPETQSGQARCSIASRPGNWTGLAVTMQQLANMLSGEVNRLVVDQSGLSGQFDLSLAYAPDQMRGPAPLGLPPPPPTDPNGASLFTAVQEQLGLKLESTTGPIDVLVIDHVEHPTAD